MSVTYMAMTQLAGESPKDIAYGASKRKTWSPMQIVWLVILILLVLLWVVFVAGAVYSTMDRSAMERVFSVLMAIFLPEFWVCYHGIDAGRAQVNFFGKLPRLQK